MCTGAVVLKVTNEHHVLREFLGNVGRPGHELQQSGLVDLSEFHFLPADLLDASYDVVWRDPRTDTQDALRVGGGPFEESGGNEFAGVLVDFNHGDFGVWVPDAGHAEVAVVGRLEARFQVGHEEAWLEEAGGYLLRADVFFHFSFAVKMLDFREFAIGHWDSCVSPKVLRGSIGSTTGI